MHRKSRIIFLLPKRNKKNSSSSTDKMARVWGGKGFLVEHHTVLHAQKKQNNISSSKEKGKIPHCPTYIEKVEKQFFFFCLWTDSCLGGQWFSNVTPHCPTDIEKEEKHFFFFCWWRGLCLGGQRFSNDTPLCPTDIEKEGKPFFFFYWWRGSCLGRQLCLAQLCFERE